MIQKLSGKNGVANFGIYDVVIRMKLTFDEKKLIIGIENIRPTDELFTISPHI